MRTPVRRILTTVAAAAVLTLITQTAVQADSRAPINNLLVSSFPSAPSPYAAFDWKQRALDYDAFVYNRSNPGSCATIQTDTTHYNMSSNTYKMATYYCDTSQLGATDGKQEAWNQLASVVSATLVGIDKSNQGGYNYVDMNRTFFNPSTGVLGDKPNDPADGIFNASYTYVGLSNVLYYMLGAQYPTATDMTANLRSIADQYVQQIDILGGANANFANGGYNWSTDMPIDFKDHNGNTIQTVEGAEGAIAAATILLWANSKFGDAKYLQRAKWAMDYVEKFSPSLFWEVMPLFGPYIAARLNATAGTHYNVSKAFENLYYSSVRDGWGTMTGQWGGYDVSGLIGAPNDGGGYAFAMNSMQTSMLSATAKYDSRYANTVGKWLWNVSNAARYFYPDQMPANKQFHGSTYISTAEHVIPYEGLRLQENGQSPSATGDPWKYGANWGLTPGTTNLSLYSGSWAGFLGGILAPTNVANINRIDLNKLDFFSSSAYPTYLYYNPGATDASVQVNVGSTAKEIYDSVTDSVLIPSGSGTQTITVPAGGSRIVVLAPSNGAPSVVNGNTVIGGVVVRYSTETPDLAYGAPVTVSSEVNGNLKANLTDGQSSTRWESSTSDPQAFYVDLGKKQTVSSVQIDWETASAKSFTVKISDDAQNWQDVYTTTSGPGGVQRIDFVPTQARYVEVYMTQRNTQWAYSAWGFHVYNDNLALSRPVTVSSMGNGNLPGNLVDGNSATRWESGSGDLQSVDVDLGAAQTINTVVLNWEAASAKSFTVEVSADHSTWTQVYSTTAGPGGQQPPITFSPTTARYVRVKMTQRNTVYAYSLWDLGVYNTDLAAGALTGATTTTNGNVAANLTDKSPRTRWESGAGDDQTIAVDLGSVRTVGAVALDWETAAAKTYTVEVSLDGSNYTQVYATTSGSAGLLNIPFTPTSVRWVRVHMTQRNTQWAYSLWEFSVYSK